MPVPKQPQKTQQFSDFSNYTGTPGGAIDTKVAAAYLKKKGLIGADQIIDTQPNINDASSIKNSQADWKPAAVQQILDNARRLNLKSPEAIEANKDVLVSNPKWRDAINNDTFKNIHPNFWDVIKHQIIPERYANEANQKLSAMNSKTSKTPMLSAINK